MNIELARKNMIESQIRTWEVFDPAVLTGMEQVQREDFVPDGYRDLAFSDCNIPLGHDEVMMAPRVEARMIQALELKAGDRVLEIGTGSGFTAAVMARQAASVLSIDIHPDFTSMAEWNIQRAGVANIELRTADGAKGYFDGGPWDVVVFTGALPNFDDAFGEMLVSGGRMFVVVGKAPVMEACLFVRQSSGALRRTVLFETEIPLLRGVPQPSSFKF
ncbi:MAG: protein-L-isoaspartate O-methyltransferase [Gammaproteobacteria bacterium]|nr:protein-L-isoaspartate O-methyltransferase [Gammaproteobacteria bacterium]